MKIQQLLNEDPPTESGCLRHQLGDSEPRVGAHSRYPSSGEHTCIAGNVNGSERPEAVNIYHFRGLSDASQSSATDSSYGYFDSATMNTFLESARKDGKHKNTHSYSSASSYSTVPTSPSTSLDLENQRLPCELPSDNTTTPVSGQRPFTAINNPDTAISAIIAGPSRNLPLHGRNPSLNIPLADMSLQPRSSSGSFRTPTSEDSTSRSVFDNDKRDGSSDKTISPASPPTEVVGRDHRETTKSNQPKSRCVFVHGCSLESPNRKVISHVFGRNKSCTRAIPDDCWVGYCRKHYQRGRYRNKCDFAFLQLELVKLVLSNLEAWKGVMSWEITLRAKRLSDITEWHRYVANRPENEQISDDKLQLQQRTAHYRWMVPFCGKGKTYADVRAFCGKVYDFCSDENIELPDIELLPVIHPEYLPTKESRKRRSSPDEDDYADGPSDTKIARTTQTRKIANARIRSGSLRESTSTQQYQVPMTPSTSDSAVGEE